MRWKRAVRDSGVAGAALPISPGSRSDSDFESSARDRTWSSSACKYEVLMGMALIKICISDLRYEFLVRNTTTSARENEFESEETACISDNSAYTANAQEQYVMPQTSHLEFYLAQYGHASWEWLHPKEGCLQKPSKDRLQNAERAE